MNEQLDITVYEMYVSVLLQLIGWTALICSIKAVMDGALYKTFLHLKRVQIPTASAPLQICSTAVQ